MSEGNASATPKVSSFLRMIIFIAFALSLTALILAVSFLGDNQSIASILGDNQDIAVYLLLIGLIGVAVSTYVLLQVRRQGKRLSIAVAPITTTIECKKCGFKNVREFQRSDYVFKEVEPCQKCNDKMLITAIYREVKEKEKFRY